MLLYKFRSMANESARHTLQIIETNQLHCSNWGRLNDPMEGMFEFNSEHGLHQEIIPRIIDEKRSYRVCSLSLAIGSHLMWAHYADGFKGLAIAIEIKTSDPALEEVQYRSSMTYALNFRTDQNENSFARRILTSKHSDWNYEQEFRILSNEEYFERFKIRHVTFGARMSTEKQQRVAQICKRRNIEIKSQRFGSNNIEERPHRDRGASRTQVAG